MHRAMKPALTSELIGPFSTDHGSRARPTAAMIINTAESSNGSMSFMRSLAGWPGLDVRLNHADSDDGVLQATLGQSASAGQAGSAAASATRNAASLRSPDEETSRPRPRIRTGLGAVRKQRPPFAQ